MDVETVTIEKPVQAGERRDRIVEELLDARRESKGSLDDCDACGEECHD